MSLAQMGAAACLGSLIVMLLLRIPRVIREPSTRITWLAALAGCVGMGAVGGVLPLGMMDGWFGGTNIIKLVQNVLAVVAFWLTMQAVLTLDGSKFKRSSIWQLGAMLLVFSVPFLMIPDRGPTSERFIRDNAEKIELWAYGSGYMLSVAYMMLRILIGVHSRQPWQYILIRIGAIAVGAASLSKIAHLTLRFARVEPLSLMERLGDAFTPMFYGGVLIMAAGMLSFAGALWMRERAWALLRFLLARSSAASGFDVQAIGESSTMHDAYRLAVRLTDISNSKSLSRYERATLRFAAGILNRQMRAPAVVQLSISPELTETREAA